MHTKYRSILSLKNSKHTIDFFRHWGMSLAYKLRDKHDYELIDVLSFIERIN